VYFPDENHWILKPRNSLLWYREFFAWLARFAPPPAKARSRAPARREEPEAVEAIGANAAMAARRTRPR
jgi:hypothetical protein